MLNYQLNTSQTSLLEPMVHSSLLVYRILPFPAHLTSSMHCMASAGYAKETELLPAGSLNHKVLDDPEPSNELSNGQ